MDSRELLRAHWLKLIYHGDLTGTNVFQEVRALFVIGRNLVSYRRILVTEGIRRQRLELAI